MSDGFEKCHKCDGRGVTYRGKRGAPRPSFRERCEECNGEGRIRLEQITLDQAKACAAANSCAIVPLEVSEAIKPLLEYFMEDSADRDVIIGELGEMVARMDGTYLSEVQEQGDDAEYSQDIKSDL